MLLYAINVVQHWRRDMKTLRFNWSEVKTLVAHALEAPEHRSTYGSSNPGPALWFVKDEGIYLMSNGKSEAQPGVVYAKGFDPRSDKEVWDRARAMVGGDDFCESLGIDASWLKLEGSALILRVSPKSIRVLIEA